MTIALPLVLVFLPISWWLLTALFYVLAVLGLFRLVVALPLLALFAFGMHRRAGVGDPRKAAVSNARGARGRFGRPFR